MACAETGAGRSHRRGTGRGSRRDSSGEEGAGTKNSWSGKNGHSAPRRRRLKILGGDAAKTGERQRLRAGRLPRARKRRNQWFFYPGFRPDNHLVDQPVGKNAGREIKRRATTFTGRSHRPKRRFEGSSRIAEGRGLIRADLAPDNAVLPSNYAPGTPANRQQPLCRREVGRHVQGAAFRDIGGITKAMSERGRTLEQQRRKLGLIPGQGPLSCRDQTRSETENAHRQGDGSRFRKLRRLKRAGRGTRFRRPRRKGGCAPPPWPTL